MSVSVEVPSVQVTEKDEAAVAEEASPADAVPQSAVESSDDDLYQQTAALYQQSLQGEAVTPSLYEQQAALFEEVIQVHLLVAFFTS